MKRSFWQPIQSSQIGVNGRTVLHGIQLLFILGRDGIGVIDWKHESDDSCSNDLGTLFHQTSVSLTRNTNTTWSTSCWEPKTRHTDWTWDASFYSRNPTICSSADEEYRNRTPLKEGTECCLAIIVLDKEHISRREAYSTSRPCLLHSWCSRDGTEDPVLNDDTRSSYHWSDE